MFILFPSIFLGYKKPCTYAIDYRISWEKPMLLWRSVGRVKEMDIVLRLNSFASGLKQFR